MIDFKQVADQNKFLFEVWLNVHVTTFVHHTYGWDDFTCGVGPIETIVAKYRNLGVIQ